MEDITEVLDKGQGVDIILLDFQKAFDKVLRKRLLKLELSEDLTIAPL